MWPRGVGIDRAKVERDDLRSMPSCSDCANYAEKAKGTGECRMAGPVPADRDADRCPMRLFVPKRS